MSDPNRPNERRTIVIGENPDSVPGSGASNETQKRLRPPWRRSAQVPAPPAAPPVTAAAPPANAAPVATRPAPPTSPIPVVASRVVTVPDDPTLQVPRPVDPGQSSGPIPVPEADGPRLIVIGGEDDLPDATYAVQTGRTPDDPKGPRVHPRLKARRVAIRQAAGRRRIWWSAVVGIVLAVAVLVMVVLASPLFAISKVEVTGAVYTESTDIASAVKPVRGKPILTADLNGVRARLEKLPWVKHAAIQMRFPHTIRIQIAERVPVASYYATDNKWRAIDIDGRVIAILDGQPVDYPAILGPGPLAVPGDLEPDYGRVAQLVISLPPKLRPMVKVFEMDQAGNVSMTLQLSEMGDTLVDLCSASALDVRQLVTLMAFINTSIDPRKAPPGRITACKPDLVTTSDT